MFVGERTLQLKRDRKQDMTRCQNFFYGTYVCIMLTIYEAPYPKFKFKPMTNRPTEGMYQQRDFSAGLNAYF